MNEHQYGFQSAVSMENASHILLNEILTAMNCKQMVGGIFCDLHKEFDCINHAVLLEKLKFYGVSGKFYNLVKSYLDERYQKVIISYNNGIESTWEKIKEEVPQGSILGPIFFFIYIIDLPKLAPTGTKILLYATGTKILLYAEDTSIIVTSPNLENYKKQINKICRDINYWFKLNQLVLHYNKTHYLQFNTKNNRDYVLKLNYHGNYVKSSPHTKFLGLIIDDSLSWKAHIDQMMSKLTLRRLMSYIYGAPILDVSRSHTTTQHSR